MNIAKKLAVHLPATFFVMLLLAVPTTASAAATLYFNNAVDAAWDTAGNWWTDASFTTPAGGIPTTNDTVFLGATLTTPPAVAVTLAHISVADASTGGGSFVVTINANINGDFTFYDQSGVQGSIADDATFYDQSKNGGGFGNYIYGTGTFYDTTYNAGYVYGDAYFYDQSHNDNYIFGANAYFSDESSHNHIVFTGDAFFACSANNNGTVGGTITYELGCPTIVSGALASDNSYVDVTVSEAVWGADDATTVLTAGKFTFVFFQNGGTATGASITSVTKTSGAALDGSETVVRVHISITGTPSGVETIAIKPNGIASIYNTAGKNMRPEQTTGALTLNAPPDTTAPDAVSDLALSGATMHAINLDWTAPGDDASTGTATTYDIRYSTAPINAGNFAAATAVIGEPAPLVAGAAELMTITGLAPGTMYYVAMKTSDEVPNTSVISNVVGVSTKSGSSGGYQTAPSPTPTPALPPAPVALRRADPANLPLWGLREGDVMGAPREGDPDVFIVNPWGYKRLFLNPVIFGFYGHLGGFAAVKPVTRVGRDVFPTSGLFRNCETQDKKVYALEVTGEDTGTLHWVNISGEAAVAQDPDFFKKDFCINSREFAWYALSPVAYTALWQMPLYQGH